MSSQQTHTDILDSIKDFVEPHAKLLYVSRSSSNQKETKRLLNSMLSSNSDDATTKGSKLEELVNSLLNFSGAFYKIRRNLKDDKGDIDHSFSLNKSLWEIVDCEILEKFGERVAGESKNHPELKINVTIAYKLEALKLLNDIKIGCYFTRNGSTGSDHTKATKAVLRGFRHKFSNPSIIFKDKDWEFLLKNPEFFSALFYEKLCLILHVL